MDPQREVTRLLTRARPPAGMHAEPYTPVENSYELYREDGENFRSVMVQVSGDHFQLDTHDMGPATEQFWGDSDYEFWAIVERAEWAKLLAALAKEVGAEAWATDARMWHPLGGTRQAKLLLEVVRALFGGDSRATDRFRDICDKHHVECSWGSWV